MKKISFIGLFVIIIVLTSHAQGIYSKQNLKLDSIQTLNLHLEKAQKLKKTGIIMSVAGPVGCIAGASIMALGYSGGTAGEFVAGTFLLLGGIITTAVGVPILITGSTRVNRVKAAINNHPGYSLIIAPGLVYTNNAQNIYPGITLRARF